MATQTHVTGNPLSGFDCKRWDPTAGSNAATGVEKKAALSSTMIAGVKTSFTGGRNEAEAKTS